MSDSITLVNVQNANGLISDNSAGSLSVSPVASATNSDNNDITLTSSADGVVVGVVTAGTQGDVFLNSGSTIDSESGSLVSADQLTVNAAGDVNLTTTISRLAAT